MCKLIKKLIYFNRCKIGFIDNGNENCLQCSINCTSCINTYDECSTCAGSNRNLTYNCM